MCAFFLVYRARREKRYIARYEHHYVRCNKHIHRFNWHRFSYRKRVSGIVGLSMFLEVLKKQ